MSESPLVEPEGVNASSTDAATRQGGHPEDAPKTAMQTDVDSSDEEGDELVGTAEQSEGGQDGGSMD